MTRTGHGAFRTTDSAVLPSTRRETPESSVGADDDRIGHPFTCRCENLVRWFAFAQELPGRRLAGPLRGRGQERLPFAFQRRAPLGRRKAALRLYPRSGMDDIDESRLSLQSGGQLDADVYGVRRDCAVIEGDQDPAKGHAQPPTASESTSAMGSESPEQRRLDEIVDDERANQGRQQARQSPRASRPTGPRTSPGTRERPAVSSR